MMRGSPVWGALNTTVSLSAFCVSVYSVRRRLRKTSWASGLLSHTMNRSCSASLPGARWPIQTRMSSPVGASDGTRPAYRSLGLQRDDASDNQTRRTGRLCPRIEGHFAGCFALPGDDEPGGQTKDRKERDDQYG